MHTGINQFLKAKEVAERYHISLATVWAWTKEGKLPSPVRLGPNTTRWRVAELEDHDTILSK